MRAQDDWLRREPERSPWRRNAVLAAACVALVGGAVWLAMQAKTRTATAPVVKSTPINDAAAAVDQGVKATQVARPTSRTTGMFGAPLANTPDHRRAGAEVHLRFLARGALHAAERQL